MAKVCGTDGMQPAEYLTSLSQFASLEEALREAGLVTEQAAEQPAVEQATAPTAEALAEQIAAKAAADEAAREALEEEASKTLTDAGKSHKSAESKYVKHLLDAGQLSSQYVSQQMALGGSRDNAIMALAGEFAKRPT